MIIRVFRARVHEEKQEEFKTFFLETALPLLRSQPGLIDATVGLPTESTPTEFLMVTTWKDLESLKSFSGKNWAKAVIHPDEEHLLAETHVHHYLGAGSEA